MAASSRMRLVSIGDVHQLTNLPKFQTFLSRLDPSPCAVVFAGDFLSPALLSTLDKGRGVIQALRAVGLTHVGLGNHSTVPLDILRQRLEEFSKSSVTIVNSNLRSTDSWCRRVSEYDPIHSPYAALVGFLGDRVSNTFSKRMEVQSVLDTYGSLHSRLVPSQTELLIPITHQSLHQDCQLAQRMLDLGTSSSVILGGVVEEDSAEPVIETVEQDHKSIHIVKAGRNAEHASIVDITFFQDDDIDIQPKLVPMEGYKPSIVVKALIDSQQTVADQMESETMLETDEKLPPGTALTSQGASENQTTVGALFCQSIKDELEVDVALLSGDLLKGNRIYEHDEMTYAQIQQELPLPIAIVVVPMARWELQSAIHSSVDKTQGGSCLQLDLDYELVGEHTGLQDDDLQVALPLHLLTEAGGIRPLMDLGQRLKEEGGFPETDSAHSAMDLIVRHSCKNRWFQIIGDTLCFNDLDLNKDGVLDRDEVWRMLETVLGHTPTDLLVDEMIASVDTDGNGVIDAGEMSHLLATMEREHNWTQFG